MSLDSLVNAKQYTYNFSPCDFLRNIFERKLPTIVSEEPARGSSDWFDSSSFRLGKMPEAGVELVFSFITTFLFFSVLSPICNISVSPWCVSIFLTIAHFWELFIDGNNIAAVATGAAECGGTFSVLLRSSLLSNKFFRSLHSCSWTVDSFLQSW